MRYEARAYSNSIQQRPTAIAWRLDKAIALTIERERQLRRCEADMLPRGTAGGRQALQRALLEPRGKRPSEYGRFE